MTHTDIRRMEISDLDLALAKERVIGHKIPSAINLDIQFQRM